MKIVFKKMIPQHQVGTDTSTSEYSVVQQQHLLKHFFLLTKLSKIEKEIEIVNTKAKVTYKLYTGLDTRLF